MTQQHTKTPWRLQHEPNYFNIQTEEGYAIADTCEYGSVVANRAANAAFIVRACNSHDALVEALEEILEHDTPPAKLWSGDSSCSTYDNPRLIAAKAALALAKGE